MQQNGFIRKIRLISNDVTAWLANMEKLVIEKLAPDLFLKSQY